MNTFVVPFNIGYLSAETYEQMLPAHYYGGIEDIDLVRDLLVRTLGEPPATPSLRVLDLGCGAGRITRVLAPYARQLHGTDKSPGMIDRFRTEFPHAHALCADTETVLADHHARGERYDLIGSFWSMSYPLLECFEDTTANGVTVTNDLGTGTDRARRIVRNLVELLAPGGHLVMLFFDAYSTEQQLVTRLWERVRPFPGTGRDHTWNLLLSGLRDAELQGHGSLTTQRLPGVAVADDPEAVRRWFLIGHLNALPRFLHDTDVIAEIDAFAAQHTAPDGRVLLPSGVNVVHFHATTDATRHLPAARP
ncbi:MAG: class I SAM-dependent methyltransferase [Actinomycetales bacterium]|nr:class I SAM-dependent methyltransferase [Actinomycetales bacterium]